MIAWLRRRRQRRIEGEAAIGRAARLEKRLMELAHDVARARTRLMQGESDLERLQEAEMRQRRRANACFAVMDRVAPANDVEANQLRTIMRMDNDDLARGVLTTHGGGLIPGEGPVGNALRGRGLENWRRAVAINPGIMQPYDPRQPYYFGPGSPHRKMKEPEHRVPHYPSSGSSGGGGDAVVAGVIGGYVGGSLADSSVHTSISPSIDVCTGGGGSASCGGGDGS